MLILKHIYFINYSIVLSSSARAMSEWDADECMQNSNENRWFAAYETHLDCLSHFSPFNDLFKQEDLRRRILFIQNPEVDFRRFCGNNFCNDNLVFPADHRLWVIVIQMAIYFAGNRWITHELPAEQLMNDFIVAHTVMLWILHIVNCGRRASAFCWCLF